MITEEQFEEQSKQYDDDMEEINALFLTLLGVTLYDIIQNGKVYNIDSLSAKANEDILVLVKLLKKKSSVIGNELPQLFDDIARQEWATTASMAAATNNAHASYNSTVKPIINSTIKPYLNSVENLSDTTMLGMFYQPNSVTPKIFLPNRDLYIRVVDNAIRAIADGQDPYISLRHSVREFSRTGIYQVYYDNAGKQPYRLNLQSAMRRNIIDGMRDVAQASQDTAGKMYGSNGVEISAHMMPAPDHAPYQGRQYSDEDFEAIQDSLPRKFGMWNCKHYMFRIILGVNVQTYPNEQLDDIIARNDEGVVDTNGILGKSGKHYTLYETTQALRAQENTIRGLKREMDTLKTMGDDVGYQAAKRLYNTKRAQYKTSIQLLEPYGIQWDSTRFV